LGTYKARRNDEASEEEQVPKTQDEINSENNANTIKNAAEVAIASKNPYAMAAGYAVKGLDKITGGKSTQALGKAMTKINKTAPGGQAVQNASNKLSESGAGDAIGKAASMKNSGGSGGAKAGSSASKLGENKSKLDSLKSSSSKSSSGSSSNSGSSSIFSNNKSGFGSLKFKLYLYGGGIFAFIIFMFIFSAVLQKDYQNLALTNETVMTPSSAGSKVCTYSEVENKAIFVGDSRTNQMSSSIVSTPSSFISTTDNGLSWFNETGINELKAKLDENSNSIVILGLGLYDLENIDNYIVAYNDLIVSYPNTNFFIISVLPVDESMILSNGLSYSNANIEAFNQSLMNAFPDKYIDIYSLIKDSIGTTDGVLYGSDTYNTIYSNIISSITSKNVVCFNASISAIDDTSLSGGSAKILKPGETLVSLFGQDYLNTWANSINNDVASAGYGTGGAVAMAAYGLIQGALNEGIILPYFWGGGHTTHPYTGINPGWGSSRLVVADGSKTSGSIQADGLDCSGFVSWALRNGGCSNFTSRTTVGFLDLPVPRSNAKRMMPGDILVNTHHIVLVLNNDGDNLVVAEAKSPDHGIVFSKNTYKYYINEGYKFLSMSDYYAQNCNG